MRLHQDGIFFVFIHAKARKLNKESDRTIKMKTLSLSSAYTSSLSGYSSLGKTKSSKRLRAYRSSYSKNINFIIPRCQHNHGIGFLAITAGYRVIGNAGAVLVRCNHVLPPSHLGLTIIRLTYIYSQKKKCSCKHCMQAISCIYNDSLRYRNLWWRIV